MSPVAKSSFSLALLALGKAIVVQDAELTQGF